MNRTANSVMTWSEANKLKLQPGKYSYQLSNLPGNKVKARLDFKIWAKKLMAVNCYYTLIEFDLKLQLTVYCEFKTGLYKVRGSEIDYIECLANEVHELWINVNQRNMLVLKYACYNK